MMSQNRESKKYERKATSAERFFTRSPFSIVTMVARIKGTVSGEMLKNALAKAQRRHALLRARIRDETDHSQWFTSESAGEIQVEIVPRKSADDWINIHAQASKIPFEFAERPPIRIILVHSPDESELIILCHHIICDGLSLAYLARDLMVHLGDPACEVDRLPDPAPVDRHNLPDDVSQSFIAKFLIKRMNRKWAEEGVYFDNEDYRILTKTYWHNYRHQVLSIELSSEETSALVTRCRKENVTVNSALTAAFCGAQSGVEGQQPYHKKIVVAANLRDRLPVPAGEGMGLYAGGVELTWHYNHQKSFWENAREFHKTIRPKLTNKNVFSDILNWLYLDPTIFEAMNFKKLGRLVPSYSARYAKLSAFSKREDVVLKLLKRDHIESLETKHWGTAVTNLGLLNFPRNYGPLELDRLIMQPGGGIPLSNVNLVLGAVTCSGKLSLVVEYAEEAVDTKTIASIKDRAVEFLLQE